MEEAPEREAGMAAQPLPALGIADPVFSCEQGLTNNQSGKKTAMMKKRAST